MFIIVQIPALYLSASRNILFFMRPSKSIKTVDFLTNITVKNYLNVGR